MRIAAGIIMLIVGIWSICGGGCSIVLGGVGEKFVDADRAVSARLGTTADAEAQYRRARQVKAILLSGVVELAAGILALVAGILFFVNNGKTLGFAAAGVGVLSEIIDLAMVGFGMAGVIKLLLYAFGALGASSIKRPEEA